MKITPSLSTEYNFNKKNIKNNKEGTIGNKTNQTPIKESLQTQKSFNATKATYSNPKKVDEKQIQRLREESERAYSGRPALT